MNPTILIIDDDQKLNDLLKGFLRDFGFSVLAATHPEKGLKKLRQKAPDLIILDVMLPGMDGFEVCRKIRQQSAVPIIMLTARGELMDKVVGLELGADDYLPKPFEPRELVARIQNVLKRSADSHSLEVYEVGDLKVDLNRKLVEKAGRPIDITANELALLTLLIQNQHKVFSRDEIMQELRGIDADIYSRAIDVLVSRLRHKLQRAELIRTVRGAGYQFVSR